MKKISFIIFIWSIPLSVFPQMDHLHGDQSEIRRGLFSANNFSTTFYNDGSIGTFERDSADVCGEWPIGSGHIYLYDGDLFVGSEVFDQEGQLLSNLNEILSIV